MDVGLVCDACSALTPIGVPQCARCGEPVALDPRPSQAADTSNNGAAAAHATGRPCTKCGDNVPANSRFCQSCGTRNSIPQDFAVETRVGPGKEPKVGPHTTMTFGGALQTARAKLTLIRGDGEDGVTYSLAGSDHFAGRGDCEIAFPDDPYLSPVHANFRYADNKLVVRDEGSLNGVYVRITGTVQVESGTTILIGEQVLSVGLAAQFDDVPDHEGTYYSATMIRPATFELVQQLRGGASGWVYRVDAEELSIGRDGNDVNFPEDPFISGRHAQLQCRKGVVSVTDLGSRNGTFVRVTGEHVLKHADFVFLGQQLLRVELV